MPPWPAQGATRRSAAWHVPCHPRRHFAPQRIVTLDVPWVHFVVDFPNGGTIVTPKGGKVALGRKGQGALAKRPSSKGSTKMIITRSNGWTIDTIEKTLSWPQVTTDVKALPDATLGALTYFGLGYLESQSAARTVNDVFRKRWLEAKRLEEPDFKAGDIPTKGVVPASDSDEYREELRLAHAAIFDKLVAGYEVGVREGSADPVTEELAKLSAQWLQGFAVAKGWFVLPPKRKVAKDSDVYADPKGRYATFGEALDAFAASKADSANFAMKDEHGKPWPIRVQKGVALCDLLLAEATKRAAAKGVAKPTVTLSDDTAVDF